MDVKELLAACNETELLESARKQGLGRLRRGMPREELIALVMGEIPVLNGHLSSTNASRAMLAEFIHNPAEYPPDTRFIANWDRIRSQLPGCTGICTKYNCTEGRHADCYANNEKFMLTSR
jgi:hypothetical protein